mgnify:FL=1
MLVLEHQLDAGRGDYPCPRCGGPTGGSYSEDGLLWAICDDCKTSDRENYQKLLEQDQLRDEALREQVEYEASFDYHEEEG